MRRLLLVLLLAALGGCASYAVVESGPQKVKAITVTPSQEWNKVPPMLAPGHLPTWTSDGVSLNTIAFISEIEDGKTLIDAPAKEEFPVFRSDMLPTEIVELIESTIAKLYQGTIAESGQLRPLTLGGVTGFEYRFGFVGQDKLPRQTYVAGAVKDGKLHVILYQAARMHYFDRHIESVAQMVTTAEIQ
jgi:hypothetical protein